MFRDTKHSYGLITRLLHWTMALAIFALFGLGWWMVGLTYYSPWYNAAPDLHKSAGMVVAAALVARFGWRLINAKPAIEAGSQVERTAAHVVHWGFYPLLLGVMVSGYLIATAKGQPVAVFGLFEVPALLTGDNLETTSGDIHRWLAWATVALAGLHTAAALKHHFSDRSRTLSRMWRG